MLSTMSAVARPPAPRPTVSEVAAVPGGPSAGATAPSSHAGARSLRTPSGASDMLGGMAATGTPTGDAGEPFEPPEGEWWAPSPRLVGARRLFVCAPLALRAVVCCLVSPELSLWSLSTAAALLAAGAPRAGGGSGRQVRSWGYAERQDDLLVRHGVLWRTIVVVPYGRMQFVDVYAGVVDRMFGLAKVQLHTASAHSDAFIPGLRPEEAGRLRDRLASRGEARLAGL